MVATCWKIPRLSERRLLDFGVCWKRRTLKGFIMGVNFGYQPSPERIAEMTAVFRAEKQRRGGRLRVVDADQPDADSSIRVYRAVRNHVSNVTVFEGTE